MKRSHGIRKATFPHSINKSENKGQYGTLGFTCLFFFKLFLFLRNVITLKEVCDYFTFFLHRKFRHLQGKSLKKKKKPVYLQLPYECNKNHSLINFGWKLISYVHFSVYISYNNRKFKNFFNWHTNETVNINPEKQNVLTDFGRTEDKENTRILPMDKCISWAPKNPIMMVIGYWDWKTEKWKLVVATDILPQGDISQK